MRPIEKGASPREYRRYQDAQPDLVERIGDYCSYCERQIETNLAVEHIQPKSINPHLRDIWDNFLLGCTNCNSCKGSKRVNIHSYIWPDTDNSFLAFDYTDNGRVAIKVGLSPENTLRAKRTIILVGLDKEPGHPNRRKRPTRQDQRWLRRQQVWDLANKNLERLTRNNTEEVRNLIVDCALARGMFSIWMKVFEADEDMRCRFIRAFRGTSPNCFSAGGIPISRVGGKL